MSVEQISMDQVPGTEIEVVAIQIPGSIEFNYDELKAKVKAEIEPYKNMIVTEEGIQGAKKARAYLNRINTTVDDRRKQIKKECLIPYEAFEVKAKEITAIVAEGSKNLDIQIAAFEVAAKERKEQEIRERYKAVGFITIPFEKIFEPGWLNATVTTKQWVKAMSDKIAKVEFELSTIDHMAIEDTSMLKTFYLESMDLKKATLEYEAHIKRVQEAKRAADAYQAKKDADDALKAEQQLIEREEGPMWIPQTDRAYYPDAQILGKQVPAGLYIGKPISEEVANDLTTNDPQPNSETINVMLALYGPKHKIETIKQFIKTLDVDFYQVD